MKMFPLLTRSWLSYYMAVLPSFSEF
jgi:hypothetical protein